MNEWKEDLYNKSIIIKYCPQCKNLLHREENLYFPDRDTYSCNKCLISFTPISPGEIIITYKIIWDQHTNNFIKKVL